MYRDTRITQTVVPGLAKTAPCFPHFGLRQDLPRREILLNGLQSLIDQRPASDQITALVDGESAGPVNTEPLRLTVSNPPTQAQVQAIAGKVDELIGMLMRI